MKHRQRRAQLTVEDVHLGLVLMLQAGASDEELLHERLQKIWEAIGHSLMPSSGN